VARKERGVTRFHVGWALGDGGVIFAKNVEMWLEVLNAKSQSTIGSKMNGHDLKKAQEHGEGREHGILSQIVGLGPSRVNGIYWICMFYWLHLEPNFSEAS
jgi:hypothetical protein